MNMEVDFGGLFLHNSTYDYDDYEGKVEPVGGAVFVSVLHSLALAVGLFGNGVLLCVLALKRRSWSLSDTFILHLSVADVLLLLTLPLLATQAAHQFEWCFGSFFCKFSGAVFNINFYCGILLLVCISLDRYLSIVHGIQLYSQKRCRLFHISCLLVWLISLILPIPDWTFLEISQDNEQGKTLCVHLYSRSVTDWQLVSRLLHLTLGFLLPTAAIIICCSFILLQLQRSSKVPKTQRAFTRVILPLVGVFFLCWTPYNITLTVDTIRGSTGNTEGSLQTALMVTKALGCVHACLRPVLYLGLCGNFRRRALAMLGCDTVQHDGSLWELCVGEEAPSDQSPDEVEEQKQMMGDDQQVQSTQC
ncbi:C-X-C chemokine receptor type 3-like [Labrus mixtus]|uniref:C-X-C chemokine receptor type 3-like n=1 Tax=Labrus mixtus TaxID=508554 RepID=UPI0029BFEC14|nr:C-X-C chemokine receptor type 3-like [Labrus mixtus]XP_060906248.1 C-X-C chemokine receptor type 3-like [Labrus mixtus]